MPRTIPVGLAARIQTDSFVAAQLVLIVRRDGTRLAFTSSDEPVVYDGDTYVPTPSLAITAAETAVGSGVGNQEAGGALTSDLITETDIAAGLYDGARVTTYLLDPTDPSLGAVTLSVGFIGAIDAVDGSFKAEVRSLMQMLKGTTGSASSPSCRCRRVGDAQCKFDLTGTAKDSGGTSRTAQPSRTVSVVGSGTVDFASEPSATGFFDGGLCEFLTGDNAGVMLEVKAHTKVGSAARVSFRLSPPFTVQVGDTARLTVGCDRTLPTCRTKFANANNYHGEWDLPGNDIMVKQGRAPG